jgi:hypothetical protein
MKILLYKNLTINMSCLVYLEYKINKGCIYLAFPNDGVTLYYSRYYFEKYGVEQENILIEGYKEFNSILPRIGEIDFMSKIKTTIDNFLINKDAICLDLNAEIYNYLNEIKKTEGEIRC